MANETYIFRCPCCYTPETLLYNNWGPEKIIGSLSHKYNGSIVRIKIPYFDWVELTPGHEILTAPIDYHKHEVKSNELRFKNAFDVLAVKNKHSRDAVVIRKTYPEATIKEISLLSYERQRYHRRILPSLINLDNDIAELIGWYVAEGYSIYNKDVYFSLGKSESNYIQRLMSLIDGIGYTSHIYEAKTAMRINMNSRILSRALPDWCGHNAREKKVPYFIFSSSKSIIRSFLTGYCNGDGSYSVRNGHPVIDIKTASIELAKAVQYLYFQDDIRLTFNKINRGEETIDGRKINGNPAYHLIGYFDGAFSYKKWQDENFYYLPILRKEIIEYSGIVCDSHSISGLLSVPFLIKNCGQLAPVDRLEKEGPFSLEHYLQTWGGKRTLTEEDRMMMKGQPFKRGGAPGRIDYQPLEVTDELRELINRRIKDI